MTTIKFSCLTQTIAIKVSHFTTVSRLFSFRNQESRQSIHRVVFRIADGQISLQILHKFQCKIGLSRLCSATFEQLLAFGATFCSFSNLEQVLPFRAIFEQNIGLDHISSTKKSTISWKTSIHANLLKAYHVINLLNT